MFKSKNGQMYVQKWQRRRRRRRQKQKVTLIFGKGISRPYIDKRNRLMLGSGSTKKAFKQKGGFFPIGAALAAAPVIVDLLGKIIK